MKRILNLGVLMLLCLNIWAGPVSVEQALQKARLFVNSKQSAMSGKRLQRVQTQPLLQTATQQSVGDTPYYIFNIGEDNGCIFVSADDRTPAILGYIDNGSFNADEMPPAMKAWLAEYERQMAQLDRINAAQTQQTEREPIDPLLRSKWNQGAPYNYQCPIDPTTNKRSVTGCVATAMAQVINYHKYPEQTTATIPAYTTHTRSISMPAIGITPIDWALITNTYENNTSPNQNDAMAVATLMKLCGQSVQMDYSSNSSGAQSYMVGIALYKYFGYDEGIQYLSRDQFSLEEWNNLIYAELAANRPVPYAGYSSGAGHEFVIDGYLADNLFHVNWGWGGASDGYFLLSILNPENNTGIGASASADGYSFGQDILVGVQKPTGQTGTVPVLSSSWLSTTDEANEIVFDRSTQGFFTPTFTYVFSNTAVSQQRFDVGLGIFNDEGALVETQTLYSNYSFRSLYSIQESKKVGIGASLADGHYVVKGISRQAGSSEWKENTNSGSQYIHATINGDQLTLIIPYVNVEATLTLLTANPKPKEPVKLRATIKNNGTTQRSQLYLVGPDDNMISGVDYDVDEGKTTTVDFEFRASSYGSYPLKLVRQDWYNTVTLAEITVDIIEKSDLTVDGIHYSILSDNDQTVAVTSKGASEENYSGTLVVPTTITANGVNYTVKGILAGAFQGRTQITELVIGDEVENIGKNAFKGCNGLTSVTFGKNVAVIESDAFSGCSKINSVYTNNLDGYCGIAFGNQNSNPLYSTKNYSRKLYVNGNEIEGELVVPEGVMETGMLAFYDCEGITKVVLPSTLYTIGKHTFSGCKQLASVEMKEGLVTIDNSAFVRCSALTKIVLPSTLSKIVNYAFSKCSGLEHVYVLAGTPPEVAANSFDAATCSKATLHVVKGMVEAYQNATGWKNFANIVEIADNELLQIDAQKDASTTQIRYYDLNGKQTSKLQKGIILVREQKADGTVIIRKVVR